MSDGESRFGDFMLLKELGRGGSSAVFLAAPIGRPELPVPVVIKRLFEHRAEHPELLRRFHHETKLARWAIGPRVARVFDAGEHDGQFYIVMEYVPGRPLGFLMEDLARRGEQADVGACIDLIICALEGLQCLHDAKDDQGRALQIVHRDVSPKNIMVRRNGEACLIDLGISSSVLKDWSTRAGAVVGSLGYMSPEQARGQSADIRSDLYALGVVLFDLLTLTNYIPRGSVPERLKRAALPLFTAPSLLRKGVPPELDSVIKRALEIKPDERFQTAGAFRDALSRVPRSVSEHNLLTEQLQQEIDEAATEVTMMVTRTVSFTGASKTELKTHILATEPKPAPRRRATRLPITAAAGVAALLGVGAVYKLSAQEEVVTSPVVVAPSITAPEIKAAPTAAVEPTPEPATPERTRTIVKKRPPKTTPETVEPKPSLASIVARAKRVRARHAQDGRDVQALDRLLGEIAIEGEGGRLSDWQQRLDRLDL